MNFITLARVSVAFSSYVFSEASYLLDLKLLDEVWQPEVLQSNILQPQDALMMFSGIKQLVFLSQELSLELEQQSMLPPKDQTISVCFQKRLPFFRLYIGRGLFCCTNINLGC